MLLQTLLYTCKFLLKSPLALCYLLLRTVTFCCQLLPPLRVFLLLLLSSLLSLPGGHLVDETIRCHNSRHMEIQRRNIAMQRIQPSHPRIFQRTNRSLCSLHCSLTPSVRWSHGVLQIFRSLQRWKSKPLLAMSNLDHHIFRRQDPSMQPNRMKKPLITCLDIRFCPQIRRRSRRNPRSEL